ncbi:hypothetical protein X975_10093, partial [Stegodyphus mimosarum]
MYLSLIFDIDFFKIFYFLMCTLKFPIQKSFQIFFFKSLLVLIFENKELQIYSICKMISIK